MKHLAVALIVIAVLAGDFSSALWLDAESAHGWGVTSGLCLLAAAWWFWHHRDPT